MSIKRMLTATYMVLFLAAIALIIYYSNWQTFIGIFLFVMANNIQLKVDDYD